MGKAIFGVIILMAFLWFLRRAFVFFKSKRTEDNALAKLEGAQAQHRIRDIEEQTEEVLDGLSARVETTENDFS